MEKIYCLWCFKEREQGEPGWFEFPENSGCFFCSEECCTHVTVKRRGLKCIDFDRIKKHAHQLRRERNRTRKSHFMNSLLAQDKLSNEDIALLLGFLTAKQKKAVTIIGLAQLSWAVHNNPKRLMEKLENLAKELRG
jgi:hypothetical protein